MNTPRTALRPASAAHARARRPVRPRRWSASRVGAALGLFAWLSGAPALAFDTGRDEVSHFIDEMAREHGFSRSEVEGVLSDASIQQSILDAISRPAERVRPWHEYREIFVTPKRIDAGVEFWNTHQDELERISAETGVPVEILVGIIGVETYFGRITGKYRVLDALVTLAFEYPPRSRFFRRELSEFLLLTREERIDPREALGSYAGAMGSPQFIPSSYRAYAVDADDNGRRDLWTSWSDVFGSVANYFVRHGWKEGKPVVAQATLRDTYRGAMPLENRLELASSVAELSRDGVVFATDASAGSRASLIRLDGADGDEFWVGLENFYVITRYNRSVMYALAVWQLGQAIAAERAANAG